jgi:hypothetical protein
MLPLSWWIILRARIVRYVIRMVNTQIIVVMTIQFEMPWFFQGRLTKSKK